MPDELLVTRTPQTEARYAKVVKRLLARYERVTGESWRTDPMAFVTWLEGTKPDISPGTWRQYKAAACAFMEKNGPLETVLRIQGISSEFCKPKTREGSASKLKSLPDKMLEQILKRLKPERLVIDEAISYFLVLGREFGLRPQEWASVRIEGDWMIVTNAKHTNGRSFGEFRQLNIKQVPPFERQMIINLCRLFEQYQKPERAVHLASQRLYRITRGIWPRRERYPTLYSARHQFAANAKLTNLSREEIAALMGHGNAETAGEHYARRKSGIRSIRIRPHPEDVAKVTPAKKLYKVAAQVGSNKES